MDGEVDAISTRRPNGQKPQLWVISQNFPDIFLPPKVKDILTPLRSPLDAHRIPFLHRLNRSLIGEDEYCVRDKERAH